jgi:hypothetical protein
MAPMGSQSEAILGAGVKLLVDADSRMDPLPSLREMIVDMRQLQVRNSPELSIFERGHCVLNSSSTYRGSIDRSQGETDIASYSVLERHSRPQHHDTLSHSRNCKSLGSYLNNNNRHLPSKEMESPKKCTDSNLPRQNACIGMKRSPALANLSLLLQDDEECQVSSAGRTRSGSLSTTSSSDSNDQDFSFFNSWDNLFPPSIHDNDDDTKPTLPTAACSTRTSNVSSCCNYTTQRNNEWGQYVDMHDFPKKRRKHF